MTITETIIKQLGGNHIFAMAFSKAYTEERAITLHIAKGLKTSIKCDRVHITLDADDTYSVQFMRYDRKAFDVVYVKEVSGVYADSLRSLVESTTGLRMSL